MMHGCPAEAMESTTSSKENDPVIDTPKQRKTIFSKFSIKTPSPLQNNAQVSKDEMKRLSVA